MATKRIPLKRRHRRITPAALEACRAMKVAETDDEWWAHHRVLHSELRCKPWQVPCTDDPELQDRLEDMLRDWAREAQ
jgi:hypothetical protein